ncbi:MAG TPA: DUF3108 domain-containing protein [Gemmatimonadaceae bacterium]|jgi:hypothetical protein|nr:DUF3108 domain-containing protein [Gemmatimonadaceae bacterium]
MSLTSQRPRQITTTTLAAAALAFSSAALAAQSTVELPFAPGERLTYNVRVGKLGNVGRGTMVVEGPVNVRDVEVYALHFDLRARVGFLTAVDRTCSWIDPQRMATLRFQKHERHPLSKYDEKVELFPQDGRWERSPSDTGVSPTDAPLDELSFIYFVRTLPLVVDTTYELTRHFEIGRNPIQVKVVRRDTLVTQAGTFPTVFVELRVKDPRRYKGEGVIGIHLSDDEHRIPVRITSSMPPFGATVLTLVAHSYAAAPAATDGH